MEYFIYIYVIALDSKKVYRLFDPSTSNFWLQNAMEVKYCSKSSHKKANNPLIGEALAFINQNIIKGLDSTFAVTDIQFNLITFIGCWDNSAKT